jgi:hypothetical protein
MATQYRIQIASHLGPHWSAWFDDLEIINNPDGTTTMQGVLLDQPALWGVLARIQSAGLTLLCLERITPPTTPDATLDRSATSFPRPGATTGCEREVA